MWNFVFFLLGIMATIGACFLYDLKNPDSDEDAFIQTVSIPKTTFFDDGYSQTDDVTVYVVKNTFVNRTQDKNHRQFSVDVKTLSGMVLFREKYSFRESDGVVYCSVDGGEEKVVVKGSSTDEIWKYGLNYLGID